MDASINNNLNKINEQQQIQYKVRFQSNNRNSIIDGFTLQSLPKMVKLILKKVKEELRI